MTWLLWLNVVMDFRENLGASEFVVSRASVFLPTCLSLPSVYYVDGLLLESTMALDAGTRYYEEVELIPQQPKIAPR